MWRVPTKEELLLLDESTKKIKKYIKVIDCISLCAFLIIFFVFMWPKIRVFSLSIMPSLIIPFLILFLIYSINKRLHMVVAPACDVKQFKVCDVVIKNENIEEGFFIAKDKQGTKYNVKLFFKSDIQSFKKGAKKTIYEINNQYYFFPSKNTQEKMKEKEVEK